MRKSLATLSLLLAFSMDAGIAPAQGVAPIDLRGRWVAISDAVVRGDATHHDEASGTEPRLANIEITYVITGQDGKRFWGTISSKRGQEPLIGAIGFDGKTIVARDTDGLYEGTIVDGNTIDVIYSHADKESAVVAAHRFTRQK